VRWLEFAYRWTETVIDPLRLLLFPVGLVRYARDWRRYRRLVPPGSGPRLRDSYPRIHDRTVLTPFDAQYFYQDIWATRQLVGMNPPLHVDVASHIEFIGMLAAVLPVTFIDIRPIHVSVDGLTCVLADGLELPFPDRSVHSLSCLHVAEHIGLGRYGDDLDPSGTTRLCLELQRVLAPGGTLLFSVPVGRPRTCFNAHRVFSPEEVTSRFAELQLIDFAAVTDDHEFLEHVEPSVCDTAEYSCGLFTFRRED
jgi:hypothetical protein